MHRGTGVPSHTLSTTHTPVIPPHAICGNLQDMDPLILCAKHTQNLQSYIQRSYPEYLKQSTYCVWLPQENTPSETRDTPLKNGASTQRLNHQRLLRKNISFSDYLRIQQTNLLLNKNRRSLTNNNQEKKNTHHARKCWGNLFQYLLMSTLKKQIWQEPHSHKHTHSATDALPARHASKHQSILFLLINTPPPPSLVRKTEKQLLASADSASLLCLSRHSHTTLHMLCGAPTTTYGLSITYSSSFSWTPIDIEIRHAWFPSTRTRKISQRSLAHPYISPWCWWWWDHQWCNRFTCLCGQKSTYKRWSDPHNKSFGVACHASCHVCTRFAIVRHLPAVW